MYTSKGFIHYSPIRANHKKYDHNPNRWIVLQLFDNDICTYYRHLYKLSTNYTSRIQYSSYGDHITIVRGHIEKPVNMHLWMKYEGQEFEFTYFNKANQYKNLITLDVLLPFGNIVRQELGLNSEPTQPFHLSLGNLV